MNTTPTVGRIVYYKLSETDAYQINKRRDDYGLKPELEWVPGSQRHVGNRVSAGDVFPMIVVRVWNEEKVSVNGQVFLDGNDTFWATSVHQGEGGHEWDWMPYQKDQQARLSEEEKKTDAAQMGG